LLFCVLPLVVTRYVRVVIVIVVLVIVVVVFVVLTVWFVVESVIKKHGFKSPAQ
jgi:hypothetical protein